MAEQSYTITFDGYWREKNIGGIPSKSGIYCVYTCIHNIEKKNITIDKLIYIGESEDVNNRIKTHEKLIEWKRYLKNGQELCFSFGAVPSNSRIRCEAAIIFKHKSPVNTEYISAFPFDKTNIKLSGKIAKLFADFLVERS